MNDANPLLQQLRDFHAPETIGFWPVAPGWWLLTLVALALIFLAVRYIRRRWTSRAWHREAKVALRELSNSYQKQPSAQGHIELNQLLKRIIARQTGNTHIVSLAGRSWSEQIEQSIPQLSQEDRKVITEAHYHSDLIYLEPQVWGTIEKWLGSL